MRDRDAPLGASNIKQLAWDKAGGLVPAVVQDVETLQVLMIGFMSPEALEATFSTGKVVFHSRSRGQLWQKGETSGNHLQVCSIHADCDGDALLVFAAPAGPTCHLGTVSCFSESGPRGAGWLGLLARIVRSRRDADPAQSYTARLLDAGATKIAQKVGEEGVELALACAVQDRNACINESADLLYHLTVLMEARQLTWEDVADVLRQRHCHEPA